MHILSSKAICCGAEHVRKPILYLSRRLNSFAMSLEEQDNATILVGNTGKSQYYTWLCIKRYLTIYKIQVCISTK